jgi:SAM-dependent methyltransferase
VTPYDEEYYHARYEIASNEVEPYFRSIVRPILRAASLSASQPIVLDVGCGIGRNLKFLQSEGIRGVGMDLSQYAVESSKQIRATGTHIPIRTSSIDAVMAIHLVEHLHHDEVSAFLDECFRVLRKNGSLILITPNAISPVRLFLRGRFFYDPTHIFFFTPGMVKSFLRNAGFDQVSFVFKIPVTVRREKRLTDLILVLLTSSILAYVRNVLHLVARKACEGN